MKIAVPRETAPNERRVALVPQTVKRLVGAGHSVSIERGAGAAAFFPDDAYTAAGALLVERREDLLAGTEVLLAVQRLPVADLAHLPAGAVVIGLAQPATATEYVAACRARGLSLLAMELVPRTTKAQAMDVLSSQATVAGYQAVLLGASHSARLLPMLTTAAGTIPPARAFILGAGVAGLQAIATARRLGAVVSAFDVRAAVKEQVQSLGATFIEAEAIAGAGEGTGGYAKELAQEQQQKVLEAVGKQLPTMDLVITTAQIPGKPAPRLITSAMLRTMKPGAVIVDLSTETGGNCERARPGETVVADGITILGPLNLPSQIPQDASLMYSRNLQSLLDHLVRDGRLTLDPADPIAGPMTLCRAAAAPGS